MTPAEIRDRFARRAADDGQWPRLEAIRCTALLLALDLADMCPPCRELSLAVTSLEEAVMWASAAVLRRGGPR